MNGSLSESIILMFGLNFTATFKLDEHKESECRNGPIPSTSVVILKALNKLFKNDLK